MLLNLWVPLLHSLHGCSFTFTSWVHFYIHFVGAFATLTLWMHLLHSLRGCICYTDFVDAFASLTLWVHLLHSLLTSWVQFYTYFVGAFASITSHFIRAFATLASLFVGAFLHSLLGCICYTFVGAFCTHFVSAFASLISWVHLLLSLLECILPPRLSVFKGVCTPRFFILTLDSRLNREATPQIISPTTLKKTWLLLDHF